MHSALVSKQCYCPPKIGKMQRICPKRSKTDWRSSTSGKLVMRHSTALARTARLLPHPWSAVV